jgi:hypothetical protein
VIILFDVDGVLVRSFAYRASLQKTVAYFAHRLGVGEVTLTDDDIEVFESQSVTVEWDSGAISVAALFLERLKIVLAGPLAPDPWAALDGLAADPRPLTRPDFSAIARRVGEATPSGGLPSHTALALFTADLAGLSLASAETLPATSLLHHLLADCYNIAHAPAMQIFQNYAIGHVEYQQYYGLPPRLESEPLLEKLDRPLLKPALRDRLLAARDAHTLYPVIYTARPSLPPIEITSPLRGYTPEAEIARNMVGLDRVPIMAFGKLDWLAQRLGLPGADGAGLIKPSSFHSIAALGAARTGLEIESLKAAFAVERGDHLRYPLTACAGETVHVFEDSSSSLHAVTRAVEKLNRQGLNLKLVRHGVAAPDSPKRETLSKIADVVHENVNDGLEEIL